MTTAFQPSAFQNNAFQIDAAPIIIVDGHDGGERLRKRSDRWKEESRRSDRKKHDILAAYEYLVEGKSPTVEDLVALYVEVKAGKALAPIINFDRMLGDVDRIERLWAEYIAMDDADVMNMMQLL